MVMPVILASGSEIRAQMLRQAGVDFDVQVARVDEQMIREALVADGALPRDIADALAESKARKVAQKNYDAFVIGCDQVLEFNGNLLSKPKVLTKRSIRSSQCAESAIHYYPPQSSIMRENRSGATLDKFA